MEEQTEGSHGVEAHGPSLEEMLAGDVQTNFAYSQAIGSMLKHFHIPMTEDGKIDVGATINHFLEHQKGVAESVFKDRFNPQRLPGYEQLQELFETYKNPIVIEHGHARLRDEVETAIKNLYISIADNYTTQIASGRQAASPLDAARKAGASLADAVSDKYLKPLIEGAKEMRTIVSRTQAAIGHYFDKAREWYTRQGSLDGFKEAYALAGGGSGGHGH